MCTGNKPAVKEVKCYLYDEDGNRFDLSPLTKKKGGYRAMSSDQETEIYINVCRDIVPGEITLSVNIIEALPGVLGIQGEGLFIFRDLGRRVIYFQGFGEKA